MLFFLFRRTFSKINKVRSVMEAVLLASVLYFSVFHSSGWHLTSYVPDFEFFYTIYYISCLGDNFHLKTLEVTNT